MLLGHKRAGLALLFVLFVNNNSYSPGDTVKCFCTTELKCNSKMRIQMCALTIRALFYPFLTVMCTQNLISQVKLAPH